jgi:hypothetical protein
LKPSLKKGVLMARMFVMIVLFILEIEYQIVAQLAGDRYLPLGHDGYSNRYIFTNRGQFFPDKFNINNSH